MAYNYGDTIPESENNENLLPDYTLTYGDYSWKDKTAIYKYNYKKDLFYDRLKKSKDIKY